jgi:molybdopterin molybdotransferase
MTTRSLSFAEARARVQRAVAPLAPESIAVEQARGRALREDVIAPHPLPPFDNSAMDGFAVRAQDLAAATPPRPVVLTVGAVIPAGARGAPPIVSGQAARIMTGAPLPRGADAVVPFEECERAPGDAECARFTAAVAPGAHVRRAGADLEAGTQALAAGRELSAHDVALLVALGRARVDVGPRPRAAVVSTGDELLDAGAPLRPGAIYDSNAPMLRTLLEEAGCEVVSVERASDAPGAAMRSILLGLDHTDVTLSIGGVSAGDFDPVKSDLDELPEAELWRVAMKPGRPQAFAVRDGKLFFGLPGNPASVACVFETLVRPALRRLQGFAVVDRPRVRVRAAARIESRRGRTDFIRARLTWRDGAWWAEPCGPQISGHLTPQAWAHALLVVPAAAEALEAGEPAGAILLRWPQGAGGG